MYHEILASLYGFSGGLMEKCNEVLEMNTFIHPGEKSLIKHIMDIASEYKQLKDFISLYKQDPRILTPLGGVDTKRILKPGLYLDAFCTGLDEALEPYRQEIFQLEERILADPHCTLTYILTKLNPHHIVLRDLNAIVGELQTRKLHGCQLLQLLHQQLTSRVIDSMNTCLERISKRCHVLFFNQLSSWVLHGQLKDSFQEFFIQRSVDVANATSTAIQENQLCLEMLPSYIPLSVARKILFVGQIIVMISNNPRERDTDINNVQLDKTDIIAVIQSSIASQYSERLNVIQNSPHFNVGLFEEAIEITRNCVTECLWELAVDQAQLPVQMRLIKDMFLLGRGELFLEFIKQAGPILNRAPSSNFSQDINRAFQTAAHMILLGNEEVKMDKFHFGVMDPISTDVTDAADGWTSLVLHYRVSWPLHLIFTPEVLDSYNQLFGFLLRVKRTQLQLHNLWQLQMVSKSRRWEDSRLWEIRTWLMFIVDHLQYYLQVDVLESQWAILEAAFKSTKKDFEALKHAHMNFLAGTLSQTFLLLGHAQNEPSSTSYQKPESLKKNPVHNSISGLLLLCEKFCKCVASCGNKELTTDEEEEFSVLCRELEYLVQFLLQLLSSLKSQPCGTHLAKLLLRLDFNRWFSRQCTGSSLTGSCTGSLT